MRMEISFQRQSISVFKHPAINDRLANLLKQRKWQENLLASKDAFPAKKRFSKKCTDERNL